MRSSLGHSATSGGPPSAWPRSPKLGLDRCVRRPGECLRSCRFAIAEWGRGQTKPHRAGGACGGRGGVEDHGGSGGEMLSIGASLVLAARDRLAIRRCDPGGDGARPQWTEGVAEGVRWCLHTSAVRPQPVGWSFGQASLQPKAEATDSILTVSTSHAQSGCCPPRRCGGRLVLLGGAARNFQNMRLRPRLPPRNQLGQGGDADT